MSIALPSTATLTGTTLVVPGLALATGQRVTLLYVDDAGAEIPLSTWHAELAPFTLPAELEALTYPVMVSTQSLGWVGYPSLEAAAFGAPNRPIVVNVPYLVVSQSFTLSGSLHALAPVSVLLEDGVTLTINTGTRLHNINLLRINSYTQKVVLAATQGGALDPWQGVQLVDSRIGPDVYFSATGHVVAARGRSAVDVAKGSLGTLYLFDVATAGIAAGGPLLVDLRPGSGFLPNVSAEPATPVGGGRQYVQAGQLKYKGPNGTVTLLAPA